MGKVMYVASEVVPFAKTGGLADVAGSLPKELAKLGDDVRVVLPKYGFIENDYLSKMTYVGYAYVDLSWRHEYCGVFELKADGITYYFLDSEKYFKRDGFYGYPDDGERFTFFSKAIFEIMKVVNFKPDILHLNDWQCSVASLLYRAIYSHDKFYEGISTVLTIHNLKFQGVFPKEVMDELLNVGWEYFHADGIEFYDKVNYLKAGIAYSDIITTVSKTYAEEIKTDYFGENLNGILIKRSNDLYGIINGIDTEVNNPETDKMIFANYSADNLDGKLTNKLMLQEYAGLQQRCDIPVIGVVSRLTDQKGFDLLAYILDDIFKMDVEMIVLGEGERKYEEIFIEAARKYGNRMATYIKFDKVLAQRMYAGCDMMLVPSRFEPCGLSQMFSLRYGTIPIVRETGGLKDTVLPYNEITHEGNGFTFFRYNAHELLYTIKQAVHSFYHRSVWEHLIKTGMKTDFSWEKSAKEYRKIYRKLSKKFGTTSSRKSSSSNKEQNNKQTNNKEIKNEINSKESDNKE